MSIDEAFTNYGDEDLLAEIERRVQAARESAAAAAVAAAEVAAAPSLPPTSYAGGGDDMEDYDEDEEDDAFEETDPPESQRTKPKLMSSKPRPAVAPAQKSIRKKESSSKSKLKPCPLCWSGSRKPLGHTGRHAPEPPPAGPKEEAARRKKPSAAVLAAGSECPVRSGKLDGHIGRHVTGDSNSSRPHYRPSAAEYGAEGYDDEDEDEEEEEEDDEED